MKKRTYDRRTSSLCFAAALLLLLPLTACDPAAAPDNGSDSNSLTLSADRVDPSAFITITHAGIAPGDTVVVQFRGPVGYAVDVEVTAEIAGAVEVSVPQFVDLDTGNFGAGALLVSLAGHDGTAIVHVNALADLGDLPAGTILTIMLDLALEDYYLALENFMALEAEFGTQDNAEVLDALIDVITDLEETIDVWQISRQIAVDLGAPGVIVLGAEDLARVDQILAAGLEALARRSAVTAKSAAPRARLDECDGLRGRDRETCVNRVTREVLAEQKQALRTGARGAKQFLVVYSGPSGLVKHTAGTRLTGLIVSVINGVVNFGSAALESAAVDSFRKNSGEAFNSLNEARKQLMKFLIQAGETATADINNPVTKAYRSAKKGKKAYDRYQKVKCLVQPPEEENRKSAVRTQSDPVLAFCQIIETPGCEDTCDRTFNDTCEDGGEGAASAGCDLGTDCFDCGARDEDAEPDPDTQPSGACCASDGFCAVAARDECTLLGNTFREDSLSCSPNPCPAPLGSCCVPTGMNRMTECQSLTAQACTAAGGIRFEAALACGAFTCGRSDGVRTECPTAIPADQPWDVIFSWGVNFAIYLQTDGGLCSYVRTGPTGQGDWFHTSHLLVEMDGNYVSHLYDFAAQQYEREYIFRVDCRSDCGNYVSNGIEYPTFTGLFLDADGNRTAPEAGPEWYCYFNVE